MTALTIVANILAATVRLAADEQPTPVSQLISPDRQHVAYGQTAVGPMGDQKVRIIVGHADGSQRRALPIDANFVDKVQWYGNDRIAYVTAHGEDGYQLIDLQGQPAGKLQLPPGCDSFFHQCLSPDGKTIAFCGNYCAEINERFPNDKERRRYLKAHPEIKQAHGLFLLDLATQSVSQVLEETVANLPCWSPDSNYLAFGIGHYVKDYPLTIVERKTGKLHRLTAKGTASGWSPDSKRLAIVTEIVQGGGWLGGIPLDGAIGVLNVAKALETGATQVDRISDAPANVSIKEPYSRSMSGFYGAAWSPDGKRLAYRHRESLRNAAKATTIRDEVWVAQPDRREAQKVLNHGAAELAWADEHTLLWVNDGQFGTVDIELDGQAALGPTPETTENQFAVIGRITDDKGRPMEGVEVRAATGSGTLRMNAPVKTDTAGSYEIHFGPGVANVDDGSNLQAVTITARKTGFYEKDACQQGYLGMANYRTKEIRNAGARFHTIVYRGQPRKLNFVMLPAAKAVVELVDLNGKPLPDYLLELRGEEIPLAIGLLQSTKTNGEGKAEFADVPLTLLWFSLGGRDKVRTEPIDFRKPGEVRYRLTYDDIAGTLAVESP
ncbi:MAG TPA: hypothetical protein VGN12_26850 [Pirellulales bacterium]